MLKRLLQRYPATHIIVRYRRLAKFSIAICFVLSCVYSSLGQGSNLSQPFIRNYSKSEYAGGTQNWAIDQGKNGVMFFGNNEGLLSFDGKDWQKYPLPNKTIVRSIELDDDHIYVGGQGEFGYFSPDKAGILHYTSMIPQIPEAHRSFGDVWDIFFIDDKICFRTASMVYKFGESSVKIIETPAIIIETEIVDGLLYLVLRGMGLYRLEREELKPVITDAPFADGQNVDLLSRKDDLLILDQRNGIWQWKNGTLSPWSSSSNEFFRENRIRNFTSTPSGDILIGTELSGVLILNENGVAQTHITKKNGLQNIFVLTCFADRDGQVWLGLENGIDLVQMGQPFGTVVPDGDFTGKAYAAVVHRNTLYLGTNNGLYAREWKQHYNPLEKNLFQLVKGTQGQVWGLDVINEELWLAHNDGAFIVEGFTAKKVWSNSGVWKFLDMGDQIIAGTYEGLISIRKRNNSWSVITLENNFKESCRILVKESKDKIWVSHPYRGVFKLEFSNNRKGIKNTTHYDDKFGITNKINNYIFSIYDNILVGTENGILKYNPEQDTFTPFEEFNKYLGASDWIQRLFEDKFGNIWYVKNNLPGLLQIKDAGLQKEVKNITFPEFPEDLVGAFELIHSIDKSNVFVGVEKGFIHIQPDLYTAQDSSLLLNINECYINDSLIYSERYKLANVNPDIGSFGPNENSLRIGFSAINLVPTQKTLYRYRLSGLEKRWTEWSEKRAMEYPVLQPGDYTFQVQAMSTTGSESQIRALNFTIKPKWYFSKIALLVYALLSILLLSGLVFIPKQRFEKEKAELQTAHFEEMEKTQEELMALKTERLESEIKFKNKELASATMHWAQKAEMLQGIKSKLEKLIQEKPESVELIKNLRRLVRSIGSDARLDDAWDQFAVHFDEIHSDFLKRLREAHPRISNNDLKLCAYLKMNLSSKEIAPLLNISVRGVEANRYRMRKKMELSQDVNLAQYIMDF